MTGQKPTIREGNVGFLSLILSAADKNDDRHFVMPEYFDFNAADIYLYRCPISRAVELFGENPDKYEKAIQRYRKMISVNPGYKPLVAGEYLYENNRLEEALPYLLNALTEAQAAKCPGALIPAMVDTARIKRANGDMQGAFEILDECERKLRGIGKSHWNYLVHAFRCRLNIEAGNTDKVEEWFVSRTLNIFTEISRIREFELIVYSRVLMSKNHLNDAKSLLQRLLAFTEDSGRLHSRVEILIFIFLKM